MRCANFLPSHFQPLWLFPPQGCSLEGSDAGPGVHMDGLRTNVTMNGCVVSGNAGPGIEVFDQAEGQLQVRRKCEGRRTGHRGV